MDLGGEMGGAGFPHEDETLRWHEVLEKETHSHQR
jgi:hypothetical protein